MMIQGFSPALLAPVKGESANAVASSNSSSTTGSSNSGLGSSTSIESTFLNLLVTELQNQDPTSPVDPTQMVGQMVSLNQLDQLININQTLSSILGAGTGGNSVAGNVAPTTAASNQQAARNTSVSGVNGMNFGSAPANGTLQSQSLSSLAAGFANNASLMNLYGSMAAPTSNLMSTFLGGK